MTDAETIAALRAELTRVTADLARVKADRDALRLLKDLARVKAELARVTAKRDALAVAKPTEMYLCEIDHVILHPDQTYIFREDPNCVLCKKYICGAASAL